MTDPNEKKCRLLIIEWTEEKAKRLKEIIASIGDISFEFETATNLTHAINAIEKSKIHIAVINLSTPVGYNIEALQALKAGAPNLPVIALTDTADDECGMQAVQLGAVACMPLDKIDLKSLAKTVKYVMLKSEYNKSERFIDVAHREMQVAELGQNRYLFILYQVARALNSADTITTMLEEILGLLFEATDSKRGAIILTDDKGEIGGKITKFRDKEIDNDTLIKLSKRVVEEKTSIICTDDCFNGDYKKMQTENIKSMISTPLMDREQVIGAIYLDNPDKANSYNEDDMDMLASIAIQVAMRIKYQGMQDEIKENAVVRANLERFHSPDVVQMIMQQSSSEAGLKKFLMQREVTILFADISDFTPLLEKLDTEEAAALLFDYFTEMSTIIYKYKGNVDKFIGDAIMATFGAPISYGNDAELAIFAAIEMMRSMEEFKKKVEPRKRFDIRIGINTGIVLSGYLGSKSRLEYTVLGDPVNIAARLQSAAPSKKIYVGEETYARVSGIFKLEDQGARRLKGKRKETRIYEVIY